MSYVKGKHNPRRTVASPRSTLSAPDGNANREAEAECLDSKPEN